MSSEREKMLAGELYDPFDLDLVSARERARDLRQLLSATREPQREERRRILSELFGQGGDTVWMQPPFFCDYELGERVFFNFNCVVLDVCRVRIGDYVRGAGDQYAEGSVVHCVARDRGRRHLPAEPHSPFRIGE